MWRRKFHREKSEAAIDWILTYWDYEGISDPAHVRAKMKAVIGKYDFYFEASVKGTKNRINPLFSTNKKDTNNIIFGLVHKDDSKNEAVKISILYAAVSKDLNKCSTYVWDTKSKQAMKTLDSNQKINFSEYERLYLTDIEDPDEEPF